MFNFFHSIVGKIAVGISSILIGAAGFISPAPKTAPAPLVTSTSEIRTTGTTTTVNFSDYAQKALKNNPSNSGKNTPTPVNNIQSFSEWKATQPPTTKSESGASPAGTPVTNQTVPAPTVITHPVIAVASPDYKPQILTILNSAKDNEVKLNNFSQECASMASRRKIQIENLAANRVSWLQEVAFDSFLSKQQTLLYDLYDNEISAMTDWQNKCENLIGIYNQIITLIDADITAVNNSVGPMTSAQLTATYSNYFGTDHYGSSRASIQNVIDRISAFIVKSNAVYTDTFAAAQKYINKVTTPTALPVQYVPPAPPLPQIPRTTYCTIMPGPSGGFAYSTVQCN